MQKFLLILKRYSAPTKDVRNPDYHYHLSIPLPDKFAICEVSISNSLPAISINPYRRMGK